MTINDNSCVTLGALFPNLEMPTNVKRFTPRDITLDSREVQLAGIFCALQGTHLNREQFIDSALDSGAQVILKNAKTAEDQFSVIDGRSNCYLIECVDLQARLGEIAGHFFSQPSQALQLVGITGTNGKTSCADLLVQCWRGLGYRAASIGTLGWSVETGKYQATGMTTLDVVENQRLLAELVKLGVSHVAMEVSSHGIDQQRVASLNFDAKILTNITRDHLDYHGDMENYSALKTGFVVEAHNSKCCSFINCDDEYGRKIRKQYKQIDTLNFYGLASSGCEVFADSIEFSSNGISAEISTPAGVIDLKTSLIGEFNLFNILAVTSCLLYLELKRGGSVGNKDAILKKIAVVLMGLHAVPGRIERIAPESNIFVDYAHTPDALEKVLVALRKHCEARLIVCFGCGGNRDKGKRPLMGALAFNLADLIVVTSDNPRDEVMTHIVQDIIKGFEDHNPALIEAKVFIEIDRAKAIAMAVSLSQPNDIVLIAGKGHETYQEIEGEKYHFSDFEQIQRLIA